MKEMPDPESIRQALQLAWQDFFQTRAQTWRTFEVEVALVVGLVGADIKFDSRGLATVLSILVGLAALSGLFITIHHREGQVTKYGHIMNLQNALHLIAPELIENVELPSPFKWLDLINPWKRYTPVHIMRMHIAIALFAGIYVAAKYVLCDAVASPIAPK